MTGFNASLKDVSTRCDELGLTLTMAKDPVDGHTIAVLDWAQVGDLLDLFQQPQGPLVLPQEAASMPLGTRLGRTALQEVWDAFVVPGQQDDAPPQSVEMRALMGFLRALYPALPEDS